MNQIQLNFCLLCRFHISVNKGMFCSLAEKAFKEMTSCNEVYKDNPAFDDSVCDDFVSFHHIIQNECSECLKQTDCKQTEKNQGLCDVCFADNHCMTVDELEEQRR